jgi:hypothetical protein
MILICNTTGPDEDSYDPGEGPSGVPRRSRSHSEGVSSPSRSQSKKSLHLNFSASICTSLFHVTGWAKTKPKHDKEFFDESSGDSDSDFAKPRGKKPTTSSLITEELKAFIDVAVATAIKEKEDENKKKMEKKKMDMAKKRKR